MNSYNKDFSTIKKVNKDTIISIAFTFLSVIFSALVATGFKISLEIFHDYSFYARTAVSFALMMISYNIIKHMVISKEKQRKDTFYGKSKAREQRYIKYVRDNHLEDLIDLSVQKANEGRRRNVYQNLLNSVSYGLDLSDIEDLNNEENIAFNSNKFEEFVKKRGFVKKTFLSRFRKKKIKPDLKKIKKLKKVINKILYKSIYYERLNTHDILVDTGLDKRLSSFEPQMTIDERKYEARENIQKATWFLISTGVTNALAWNGFSPEFWISLLSHTILILSSVINGLIAGYNRINTLTLISENKCDFLNVALKEHLVKQPLE